MKTEFYTELKIKVRIEEETGELENGARERRYTMALPGVPEPFSCGVLTSAEAERFTAGQVVDERSRQKAVEILQKQLSVSPPSTEVPSYLKRTTAGEEKKA